jgi:hypothetical protein
MGVFRTALGVSLAAAMIACRGSQFPEDALAQLSSNETVILDVRNNNWADAIIYIVHDGRRTRLNTVRATRTTSLVIPPNMIGQAGNLQLIARRVGAYDRYISPSISIRTGSTVVLTLESDLRRSTVAVW